MRLGKIGKEEKRDKGNRTCCFVVFCDDDGRDEMAVPGEDDTVLNTKWCPRGSCKQPSSHSYPTSLPTLAYIASSYPPPSGCQVAAPGIRRFAPGARMSALFGCRAKLLSAALPARVGSATACR